MSEGAPHLALTLRWWSLSLVLLLTSGLRSPAQIDSNSNGMSDVWETAFSSQGSLPTDDPDGDGQSNYEESLAGTDPHDAESVFRIQTVECLDEAFLLRWHSVAGKRYQVEVLPAPTGSWTAEGPPVSGTGADVLAAVPVLTPPPVAFRLRLLVDNPAISWSRPFLAEMDTDGDGFADIDEFAAGTDPFDAASFLAIKNLTLGKAVRLRWPTVAGKRYQVQSSASLPGTNWSASQDWMDGTGYEITATISVTGQHRFFRAQVRDRDSDFDGVTDWEERIAGTDSGPFHYRTNTPTFASNITTRLAATNVINLEVATAVANVTRLAPGAFRVLRYGNLNQLTVHYAIGGDATPGIDYAPLPGLVVLPPGVDAVEIPVFPLVGATPNPSKSITLTLLPNAVYAPGTNTVVEIRVVLEIALAVADFGAVGDGVTDDTAAIQSAINALEASTNFNTLHFRPGTYRLNSPVIAPNNFGGGWQLLRLGATDLAGRDLFFTGDEGAVLYSTASAQRTRILGVRAGFRSLTFQGLTWRKDSTPLPATLGEPNGAEGVGIVNHDFRRVEAINFLDCTFENCHGAVFANGYGYDLRGRLGLFGFFRCRVLNPHGSNTLNGGTAFGGGQQVRINPWTYRAIYADNFFEGGSGNSDPVTNPGGVRKDGSHFGAPLHLIFTNNVVRRMDVEAVYPIDDPLMGYSSGSFIVPPADGSTPVAVPHIPFTSTFSSTYAAGQILNFRTFFSGVPQAVNVFLTVVAFDSSTWTLTVKNDGLTPGIAGAVMPNSVAIYLQIYDPAIATITDNFIDSVEPRGDIGIGANAKATITRNFIRGYVHGMYLYPNVRNPLFPPTPGTIIASNVVLTRDPLNPNPFLAFGIRASGGGEIVFDNFVATPVTYRFVGVSMGGPNFWVENNMVIPRHVISHPYNSTARSVGIGFANGTTGSTAVANRTYGMDVGIGPETPFQITPHHVLSHFSTNDVLAIDPRCLLP